MTPEKDKIVAQALNGLAEHFDVVLVMVSDREGGDTVATSMGTGNYYARLGMAHEYIERANAQTMSSFLKRE